MTEKIVVAHGGDVSGPSGGTNRVTAFASGLSEQGFEVTLVAPKPEGTLPERLSHVNTSLVSTPNSSVFDQPLRGSLVARRACKIAEREDAKIQFEHSTLAGLGQLIGGRGYILDMHDLAHSSPLYGGLPLGSFVQRAIQSIEGRAVRSADKIIVVSEMMRSLVTDEWRVDSDDITVIPNGYFSESITPYTTNGTHDGRVVFLGTLHPKLNTEAFFEIAALSEVNELVVIGDGAKRTELEDGKAKRGLSGLKIKGRLPDEKAYQILARAAIAINPQTQSPLQEASSPVKIYYYSALGIPMVLSEGPSVAHALSDCNAADIVPFGNSFSEAVRELLLDEQRRSAMSDAAQACATEFSWSHRIESLTKLY